MNRAAVEAQLAELPLAEYVWFETAELEFSERIRTVCRENCPRYNKTWACPPAVGSVEVCRARCLSYPQGLLITSLTEVADIADTEAALATRGPHEELTRAGLRHPARAGRGGLWAFYGIVCHLRALCMAGRPLPPPGPDVSLRGEPWHRRHGTGRAPRDRISVRRQCRHMVLSVIVS